MQKNPKSDHYIKNRDVQNRNCTRLRFWPVFGPNSLSSVQIFAVKFCSTYAINADKCIVHVL